MLKKITCMIMLLLMCSMPCYAGVFNDFEGFRGFVNAMDVKAGTYFDLDDGRWMAMYSGSLYTWAQPGIPVVSWDLGYAHQNTAITSLLVDVLSMRMFGFDIHLGPLEPKVGYAVGWDFGQQDFSHGTVTMGFTIGF